MTLFFDLTNLELEAKSDAQRFIALLKQLHAHKPTEAKVKHRLQLVGKSFLLNPAPFLNSTADVYYKVQYVKLAARRNYLLYKLHQVTYLDLSFFPDIALENIIHNPLLNIANKQIHFKYEDKTNGNFIR